MSGVMVQVFLQEPEQFTPSELEFNKPPIFSNFLVKLMEIA